MPCGRVFHHLKRISSKREKRASSCLIKKGKHFQTQLILLTQQKSTKFKSNGVEYQVEPNPEFARNFFNQFLGMGSTSCSHIHILLPRSNPCVVRLCETVLDCVRLCENGGRAYRPVMQTNSIMIALKKLRIY